MTSNKPSTSYQTLGTNRKIILFAVVSSALHVLVFSHWNDPLLFDFGGQQHNSIAIEIALAAPEQLEEEPNDPLPPIEAERKHRQRPVEALKESPDAIESTTTPAKPQERGVTEHAVEKTAEQPAITAPERDKTPIDSEKMAPVLTSKASQYRVKKRAAATDEADKSNRATETLPASVEQPPVTKNEPRRQEPIRPEPQQKVAAAPPEEVRTTPTRTAENSSIKPDTPSETQSNAMILRLIQAEIERHFQYPKLAQRRGWQGEVRLKFSVHPDGQISNIEIKRGAQYGVLNHSALQTMKKVNRLTRITSGTLNSPIVMELPIIYKLQ